jgi:hypothetical protein
MRCAPLSSGFSAERRAGKKAEFGAGSFLIESMGRRKKIEWEAIKLWNSKCPP